MKRRMSRRKPKTNHGDDAQPQDPGEGTRRRDALIRFAEELADLAADLYARGDPPSADSKKKTDGPDGGAEGNDK